MKRIIKKFFIAAILLIILVDISIAQQSNVVQLTINNNFDIRKISQEYFGSPELWPYILKFNKLKAVNDIKPGAIILIPVQKVKDLIKSIEAANSAIQNAVLIGSKVLAEDLLNEAQAQYKSAVKLKNELDYDAAESFAKNSTQTANRAYTQTKEIRERTIDAIVSFKKGTLQKRYTNMLAWQNAELYENLKENDMARTLAVSIARITFHDLSQIKLNENAQAVIQRTRIDVLTNKTTSKIKIEKGDAYAMLLNSPKKEFNLEIPGVKTKVNSKYFWVEKGANDTKVANYNGEITLETDNKKVVVQKNQGSIVSGSGVPSDAKNLLQPPKIISPENLANILLSKIDFSWTSVEEASNYWIEIATDQNYKTMYDTRKNITSEKTTFENFKKGIYYWHVCSVDKAGLPGTYSETRYFIVSPDLTKPFLAVESPANNFTSRNKNIIVKGKTESGNKIIINNTTASVNKEGLFSSETSLMEGKNRIFIQASNNNNASTEKELIVYCETDPDINISSNSKVKIEDGETLNLETHSNKLKLYTRAFSSIEIKSTVNSWLRTGSADSLGYCELVLPIIIQKEQISLHIKTMAGYERNVSLFLISDNQKPSIKLIRPTESVTNKNKLIFSGTVENAIALFINERKIELNNEQSFDVTLTLDKAENVFNIKAVNQTSGESSIEKVITYDNQPPKLISQKIVRDGASKSMYKIIVKAEDQTQLKKTAEAEISIGPILKTEVLQLNENTLLYEGVFIIDLPKLPVLKSVTLQDYQSNSKTYLLTN